MVWCCGCDVICQMRGLWLITVDYVSEWDGDGRWFIFIVWLGGARRSDNHVHSSRPDRNNKIPHSLEQGMPYDSYSNNNNTKAQHRLSQSLLSSFAIQLPEVSLEPAMGCGVLAWTSNGTLLASDNSQIHAFSKWLHLVCFIAFFFLHAMTLFLRDMATCSFKLSPRSMKCD